MGMARPAGAIEVADAARRRLHRDDRRLRHAVRPRQPLTPPPSPMITHRDAQTRENDGRCVSSGNDARTNCNLQTDLLFHRYWPPKDGRELKVALLEKGRYRPEMSRKIAPNPKKLRPPVVTASKFWL